MNTQPNKAEQMLELFTAMNVSECAEFIKLCEEKLGITLPVAGAAAPAAPVAGAQPEAEQAKQNDFSVSITGLNEGAQKVNLILQLKTDLGQELGTLTKMYAGLEQGTPIVLRESVSKSTAEELTKLYTGLGAILTVK